MHATVTKADSSHESAPTESTRSQPAANGAVQRAPLWAHTLPPLQAKLIINRPGDKYEQEADRVADQVMRMAAPQVQRKTCSCGKPAGPDGMCEECKRKQLGIQRMASGDVPQTTAPPIVHRVLQQPGHPLETSTRNFMESRFGQDFGQVRVHADAKAAKSAEAVNARAYTVGRNVVFGSGQLAAGTTKGRRLLAHELVHIVQQSVNSETASVLMRQPCSHDGTAPRCGGGGLARWRLVNEATREVTDIALDDLIIRQGVSRHFGGTWVTQVQTPPNPVKSGRARGRVDGLKANLGDPLRVEVVEVKSRSTQFNGGCELASREVNGYVRVLQAIAPHVAAISRVAQRVGGLRSERGALRSAQRQQLAQAGIDLDNTDHLQAWRFYNSLQNRLNTTFTTGFSSLQVGANQDGTPGQDYEAGPPVLVSCRTRQRRPGVRTRQLLFQVNGSGGISYGCRNTDCYEEEEERQRQQVAQPEQRRQEERSEESQPQQVGRPVDQPETDITVPILVGAGGAALTAGGIAAARRRAARLAAQRLAAEAARREAQRRAAQAAWRRAAASAARRRAARAAGQGAGRRVAGRAVGRAVVYAEAAAAVFLLLSGRAEARPGPGQSALESLYQSMSQNGTPPSPEMRELIENDPLLRQLAEEAASSGNAGPLQEELTRRMMEIVRDNPEQFTPEDLEILMQASDATSGGTGTGPQTAEQLRSAIERARAIQRGEEVSGSEEGPGTGTGPAPSGTAETPSTQGEPRQSSSEARRAVDERYPNASAETRRQLIEAPNEVRRLFNAMTSGSSRGPQVTDEAIRRFLQIVPGDLTPEQAQQLIERLRPAETNSLDEILGRLQRAIEAIRGSSQPEEAQNDTDEVTDEPQQTQPEPEERPQEGVTLDEYARSVVEQINRYGGWNGLSVEETRLIVTDEGKGFNTARLNTEVLTVVIYGKMPAGRGFRRIGAFARVVVTSRTRRTVNLEFRSPALFVDEAGNQVGTISAGHRLEQSRLLR